MNNREIRVIFLYEFKLGHNAAEATRNINQAFGEDTAKERTVRWWFEKFRSGDMSLENKALSYNDLKFSLQIGNFICNNLILFIGLLIKSQLL
jgi:hypothetical protein